jgi:hypothetical protein
MKRQLFLISILSFVISCKQNTENKNNVTKECDVKISKFEYPGSLEKLVEIKYKCDTILPFIENDNLEFTKKLFVIFSDRNYSLINFDRKTRLLWDKREDIIFAFKASEIDNFYFNKSGYKELYPLTIYILNKQLMPIYHFQSNEISIFHDDKKNKKFKEFRIELEKKSLAKNIDVIEYENLVKIVKELNANKYMKKELIGGTLLDYFYKNPPVWTEL